MSVIFADIRAARLDLQPHGHVVQQRRHPAVVRGQVAPEEHEGLLRTAADRSG